MTLFLMAHMADTVVAISTDQVESVIDVGEVIPVPRAMPAVRGLTALRSRVVTVVSARMALDPGAAPATPGRAVVTVVDGHHYAILVQSLEDVAAFEMAPLPPGLVQDEAWSSISQGVVDHDGQPTLAIELRSLVTRLALAA